ncbi:MAG TPA: CoA pyrophosphatase [Actinomycetota bacterium]|nr:CoA pyrophosphatase [Actinomycetota bacterium]
MTGIAEALRGTLAPPAPDPPLPPGVQAGVLVPVVDLPSPAVVLTRRSDTVRDHKGEISFPGGVRHAEDPDLLATALRETEEELGIAPSEVEVIGALPPTETVVTGYVIVPYVGMLAVRPEMRPSAAEIAEVLEIEVALLTKTERAAGGPDPMGRFATWFQYELDGHVVWGATGRIVHSFLKALRAGGWTEEG